MERMSLSSSPPSSRLPPDGHEFPANYDENSADLTSSKCRPVRSGSGGNAAANWRSNRDERSERSVRDKIALFTHDDRGQIRSTAAGSVPATPSVASTGPLKSRRENTSLGSSPPDTKYVAKTLSYSVDNLSSSSSINNNNSTSNGNSNNNNNSTSTTLKALQGSAKGPLSCSSPRSRDFSSPAGDSSNLSERSRSLLDVAQSSHKRHSVGNLAATLAQRKTSLMNLAESRRKSISKLRGLVIPDPVEIKTDARLRSPRGIIDMPEIISKDSVLAQGKAVNLPTLSRTDPLRGSQSSVTSSTSSGHDAPDSALKKTSLTSLPWKSNSASNTLPKYSPAFKRKELTVPRSYVLDSGQVERPASDAKTAATATNKTPPVPLLPLPPLPKPAVLSSAKELINSVDSRTPSTVTSSHSHEESSDTDGDSALSSSRSSFSQSESPIPSVDHKDEVKIGHQESSTAAVSAAAAAARVLKAHSVEALNRKNVLQSARYSSGGGLDSLTSPPIPAESRPLKLSSPTSPNRSSDSLSSPKDPSPLLARSRKAPDFEQTLKMFASTEKEAKSERASPKSLRSGDRLEIKTAFINDVYDDPNSIQTTTRDRTDVKVSPVDVTVLPSPVTRKVSSGSESSRRNSNEMDSKILAAKASGGSGSSQRETPREVKSFRALAERWEAMANDAPPVSSGSSSPLSPPAKLFPPVQAAPVTASKKMEVKQVEEDDDFPMKRFSLLSKLTQETTAYESSLENGDHESSFTVVTSSLSTSSSSRSSKSMAGVVEIRKAFERVREELETESNSNMDLPMNLNAADELSSETFNIFKPHGIFSMSSTSNFASNSSCSTSYHTRMSSLDSNASGEDCSFPYGGFGHYGIGIGLRDHYGSITSLASSTSLISPQELQQLLDDANQSLEESGTPSHEIVVVVLHRGDASGPASLGLGITLAGGADYETKEITVHKVISGSVADRDGRVQRGDRVLSINGKSLKGVTHREALAILKAPRPEVVLVLSRKRSVSPQDQCSDDKDLPMMIASSNTIINSRIGSSGHVISSRPPRILESPSDFGNYDTDEDISRGPPLTTTLIKDGAGLGFSLEGGKDSPLGDRPLTVKKIFTGGAASKNGVLRVGDQIITVNGCDVTVMSRIEAWNLMKKLPDGVVTLVIRQSLNPASS